MLTVETSGKPTSRSAMAWSSHGRLESDKGSTPGAGVSFRPSRRRIPVSLNFARERLGRHLGGIGYQAINAIRIVAVNPNVELAVVDPRRTRTMRMRALGDSLCDVTLSAGEARAQTLHVIQSPKM